jgi:hypothetical protein
MLWGEAESHGPFGKIVFGGGKAGDGDGPGVALGLGRTPRLTIKFDGRFVLMAVSVQRLSVSGAPGITDAVRA